MSRRPTLPWKKIAAWCGAIFVLAGAFGFFALPPLVKSLLVKELGATLHREVSIEKIAINPYTLTFTVSGFDIKARGGGGSFVAFDELFASAEWSSVLRFAPVLKELRLTGPRLNAVHEQAGHYNFSDLLDEFMAKPAGGPLPRFAVSNIQVSKGRIDFDDKPAGTRHEITDIELGIPFISSITSFTHIFVEPKFSAKLDGTPADVTGKTKPFDDSLETALTMEMAGFELPRLAGYIPANIKLKIPSGRLDGKLEVKFMRPPGQPAKLSASGDVRLSDLVVTDRDGTQLVKLKQLDATLADFSPLTRTVLVSRVSVDAPELSVRRDESGQLNLLAVLPQPVPETSSAGAASSFTLELGEFVVNKAKLVVDNEASRIPWRASIDSLDLVSRKLSSSFAAPLELDVSISGMRIVKTGGKDAGARDEVLRLPLLRIKDALVDVGAQEITLGEFETSGGKFAIARDQDGQIDVVSMFEAKVAPTLAAAVATVKQAAPTWDLSVKKLAIADYGVVVTDAAAGQGATLSAQGFSLSAQDLSTHKDARAKLTLKTEVNKTGALNLDGTLVLEPLAGNFNVDATGIAILPFQPYFQDRVKLDVTGGTVAMKGAINWKFPATAIADNTQIAALSLPVSGDFSGVVEVTELATIERESAEDLFRWKSLRVGPMRGTLAPLAVQMEEIALSDFYARVILFPEGRLNVLDLLRRVDNASAAVAPARDLPIDIGRLTLRAGHINFFDRLIKPNSAFNLTDLTGGLTRLSAAAPADIDVRGSLDNSAPLLVSGKVNPLSKELFLDIKASVKGFDLSPLTPYAGRYLGYGIEKGKMSLETTYKLVDRKLQAEHQLFLDQLTLGEKMDSVDAVKLPVALALALLKDRNGNIDLDVPISGTLDDPQFSVAALVFKVIGNIIGKVLSAPFTMLGSLFGGGGEELSWVEFGYGSAAIDAAATGKLGNLAKALNDRPTLKLDISGHVDPENDKEGLRRARLEQSVKTQKFRVLASQGKPAASVAEVSLDAGEYLQYLERAYDAEKFPKPRNALGLAKSLPKEEMEALMLANIDVTDDDLGQLADRRARATQEALLKAGVSSERVFLLASTREAPALKDKAKASRVDLALR